MDLVEISKRFGSAKVKGLNTEGALSLSTAGKLHYGRAEGRRASMKRGKRRKTPESIVRQRNDMATMAGAGGLGLLYIKAAQNNRKGD